MSDCENIYCIMFSIHAPRNCGLVDKINHKVDFCCVKQVYDSVENEKNPSKKKLKFPSLNECLEVCLKSVTDKKLSDDDEHMIGATWAFIDGRLRRK